MQNLIKALKDNVGLRSGKLVFGFEGMLLHEVIVYTTGVPFLEIHLKFILSPKNSCKYKCFIYSQSIKGKTPHQLMKDYYLLEPVAIKNLVSRFQKILDRRKKKKGNMQYYWILHQNNLFDHTYQNDE